LAEAQRLRYSRGVTQKNAVSALAGIRMAIGVASWTTPRLAGKLFGLDARANPQSPYLARLFGVRDVALAWGALSSEGDTRRQWLTAGLACGRGGYLPKLTSVLVSATALSAVVLGAAALGDE
jgi:hypothetical protein